MHTNTPYQTNLFRISAIFNITIGLALLFNHQWFFTLFGYEITAEDAYLAFIQVAGIAIASFGVGYYWASKDFQKNSGLIQLGAIAKIGVFAVFLSIYIQNSNILPLFIAGSLDLTFAALFFIELKKINKNS